MNKALIAAALLAAASFAAADDNPPPPSLVWTGNLNVGYVSTAGNSRAETLNASFDLKKEQIKWRHALHLEALNSSSDGTRNAERYLGNWQSNYKFNERQSVFGRVEYEDDRFSSYEYQATLSVGYSHRVLDTERYTLDLEAGPGYRRSETIDHVVENEPIVRAATNFVWHISDTATFTQDLSTEAGTDNTIVRSRTGLLVDINESWAVKLGYKIKWTHNVEPDKKQTDRETTVSMVYKF